MWDVMRLVLTGVSTDERSNNPLGVAVIGVDLFEDLKPIRHVVKNDRVPEIISALKVSVKKAFLKISIWKVCKMLACIQTYGIKMMRTWSMSLIGNFGLHRKVLETSIRRVLRAEDMHLCDCRRT